MSILTTDNLGLSFGAFDLFQGISVKIAGDSKIGLIGPNGIGKTSLLLILAGLKQPTSGHVNKARGRRLGYLRQEAVDAFAVRENTVYAEMLTVFARLQAQQARLHEMEAAMESGDFDDELLEAYGSAQEAFEQAGGYDYDVRIQCTLQGLGLGRSHWEMPLCKLSGGQQTRALLARLLLEQPDLLILDEPTNHLDAEAIAWLEHTLSEWPGAILIVSHDRYFLDHVVSDIWEMSREGIQAYSGNYSAYLLQRQERWERQRQVYFEEKARLEKELEFVQRNLARATTHDRAFGLLKRLSRDLIIVENLGIMALRSGRSWSQMGLNSVRPLGVAEAARRLHAIPEPKQHPVRLNMRMKVDNRSGSLVLSAHEIQIGYPYRPLFWIENLELKRGECAALIGANGTGKTTFLKTLLGQVAPLEGQIHLGLNLKPGYFAQAHEDLDPENTVIEELLRHQENPDFPEEKARNHLGQYQFSGEDVFKRVSSLSGGERGRLAFAILALQGANFLLLDEPTNHLDIPAQETLQEALENFPGAILLVSHDRYLVDRLANQVWELKDGRLRVFKEGYQDYLNTSQLSGGSQAISEPETRNSTVEEPISQASRAPRNGSRPKSSYQRTRALTTLETSIHEQEAALERIRRELQSAGEAQSFNELQRLSWEFAEAQAHLEKLTAQWEELASLPISTG